MSEPNDGGPAFPNVHSGIHPEIGWDSGMTLRDYFAAHAPVIPEWYRVAWLDQERVKMKADSRYQMRDSFQSLTEWSFDYADAMLSARKPKGGRK